MLEPKLNFRSTCAVTKKPGARKSSSVQFSGAALTQLRTERLMSQEALSAASGLSRASIQNYEGEEKASTHAANFRKLATGFAMSPEQLLGRLALKHGEILPSGIGGVLPVSMVPKFEQGIAASHRDEVVGEGAVDLIPVPVQGRAFVVNVVGECMLPTYKSGDLVVFSYDAVDSRGLSDGDACYVQLADGTATFKLVYRDPKNNDGWELRCLNKSRFPKVIRVHRDEVVRVAKAVGKFQPI